MSNMQARHAGYLLKQEREKRGWTLSQVYLQTGGTVTAQTLSSIETGRTEEPGFRLLCELAKVYGLDPNTLAEWYDFWTPADRKDLAPSS